jgi:hypothetical protein
MNPSEFQLSGTRDANGEIKISAQEAMNPKEHKMIKFDKENAAQRAILSASADKDHPNHISGTAIHAGGHFSIPNTAIRKPNNYSPAADHRRHKLITDAMAGGQDKSKVTPTPRGGKKSTGPSPLEAVAAKLGPSTQRKTTIDTVTGKKTEKISDAEFAAKEAKMSKARAALKKSK